MKITDRKAIRGIIEEALENITIALEEDRHHPSIPEAGTAPTESAMDNCRDYLAAAITEIGAAYGVVDCTLVNVPLSFDELMGSVTMENHQNFDELSLKDEFIRDNGERKYHYLNFVYQYQKQERYICVEIQATTDNDHIALMGCSETEKKEKIEYVWT